MSANSAHLFVYGSFAIEMQGKIMIRFRNVIFVVFAMAFAGCGGSDQESAETDSAESRETQSTASADATPADAEVAEEAPVEVPVESVATPDKSVQEVLELVDLRDFPLPDDAEHENYPRGNKLTYLTKLTVASVVTFYEQLFEEKRWSNLTESAYSSEAYSSRAFAKSGFTISLSASDMDGQTSVSLINNGNVDLARLPQMEGTTIMSQFPNTMLLQAPHDIAAVFEYTMKELLEQGWKPYQVPDSSKRVDPESRQESLVNHGMDLSLSMNAAVDHTKIQLTVSVLPLDLPILDNAEQIEYTPRTHFLRYLSASSFTEIETFYGEEMINQGWNRTQITENRQPGEWSLVYAHQKEEILMTLIFDSKDSKTKVTLRPYSSK